MPDWNTYPSTYRAAEVAAITAAVKAGECVSVIGLSGAGKSNLLGFIANRVTVPNYRFVLADCNRLTARTHPSIFRLMRRTLTGSGEPSADEFSALDTAIENYFKLSGGALSILLDLSGMALSQADNDFFNNLRALRDIYKFQLTFVTATRRPLPAHTEFAELVHANTIWLGPLSEMDSRWNVTRYAERKGLTWDEATAQQLIALSRGYPSLLKAACEAYSAGAAFDSIATHPAMQARVEEFWADKPTDEELRLSGLADHPLLTQGRALFFDTSQLTAKEHLLLNYFLAHIDTVCEKDEIIRAAWPEDKVFERGVRDDSLAQLIRRLREKIEPDPANPRHIQTVPGRGYRFKNA